MSKAKEIRSEEKVEEVVETPTENVIVFEAEPVPEVETKKKWYKNWKIWAGVGGATVTGIVLALLGRASSDKDVDAYVKLQESVGEDHDCYGEEDSETVQTEMPEE